MIDAWRASAQDARHARFWASRRVVTLGLDRFGLPELVVNQALRSDGDRAHALVRLVAMTLEQPGARVTDGFIDLDA